MAKEYSKRLLFVNGKISAGPLPGLPLVVL